MTWTPELIAEALDVSIRQEGTRGLSRRVVIDSRVIEPGDIFFAIRGVRQDGHQFISKAVRAGAGAVVLERENRDVPADVHVFKVRDSTRALGQMAAYHRRRFSVPVIAVTGSAGKTAVKDMAAHVLSGKYRILKTERSLNNHWGLPLTLLNLSPSHQAVVVELGINRPGEMEYLAAMARPDIAVFTNIGASHLAGLKSLKGVLREKAVLLKHLSPGGLVIFNDDDALLRTLRMRGGKVVRYSLEHRADIFALDLICGRSGMRFLLNGRYPVRLKTPVRAMVANALAAAACGRALGMTWQDIVRRLESFRPCVQRQCLVKTAGMTIIDDTYNANPLSYASAAETLRDIKTQGKKIAVCGDMLELGRRAPVQHRKVGKILARAQADLVVCFGPQGLYIKEGYEQARGPGRTVCYTRLGPLNRFLAAQAGSGDTILIKGSRGMRMERVVDYLRRRSRGGE
ncbi:MAG: UDP-N-acetylmuramoyl-tripeptide--D-alanyl-D-alanine ligase [Candidatus Omnitrophota bacterium]